MNSEFINAQGLINEVYKGIDALFRDAQKLAVNFYNEQSLHKSDASWNRGSYCLRVKETTVSFTIFWEEVEFVSRSGNATKRRIVKYIKPSKKGIYTIRQFKKATQWEIDIIEKTEVEAKKIRKSLEHLGKVHRAVLDLAKHSGLTVEKKLFSERNIDFIEQRKRMRKLLQSMA